MFLVEWNLVKSMNYQEFYNAIFVFLFLFLLYPLNFILTTRTKRNKITKLQKINFFFKQRFKQITSFSLFSSSFDNQQKKLLIQTTFFTLLCFSFPSFEAIILFNFLLSLFVSISFSSSSLNFVWFVFFFFGFPALFVCIIRKKETKNRKKKKKKNSQKDFQIFQETDYNTSTVSFYIQIK